MFVVMQEGATEEQVQRVIDRMVTLNFTVHRSTGIVHTVLGGVGPEDEVDPVEIQVLDG
jgi:3-deoxy-7-phosphoheptulonate synthase